MAEQKPDVRKLEEQLNSELEEFVSNLKPSPYNEGWAEENWENEMEKHPLFMTKGVNEVDEMPPLLEALQQLKYDPAENTATELAMNYKEDGNQNFKLKKYRWAVDSYTEGIKQKCSNIELNAQLYANRAAAHFHLGNYRSSLQDCISAKSTDPSHVKAIIRGAMCCKELKAYKECISWCDEALKLKANDTTLIELKMKAEKGKIQEDRDKRKKAIEENKQKLKHELLQKALKERKIHLKENRDEDGVMDMSVLEPIIPALAGNPVHLHVSNCLVWPVVFLYAEYGVTDVIQNFKETSRFNDHLEIMFPERSDLEWDVERKYSSEKLQIYFENCHSEKLVEVEIHSTLQETLSDERLTIGNGTPIFFLTVKNSSFDQELRAKHGIDR